MERERRHQSSRSSGAPPMDTTIDEYNIGKEIGKGSFAIVFKGVHTVSTLFAQLTLSCYAFPNSY